MHSLQTLIESVIVRIKPFFKSVVQKRCASEINRNFWYELVDFMIQKAIFLFKVLISRLSESYKSVKNILDLHRIFCVVKS